MLDYFRLKSTDTPTTSISRRPPLSKSSAYEKLRARSRVFDIYSPATEMELYACGKNEAGNLNLPRVCIRWHVLGNNPCEHNNYCRSPEDPSYCPRMLTRLTYVLNDETIRFIAWGNSINCNSTIIESGGGLKVFGLIPSSMDHSNNKKPLPRFANMIKTDVGDEMLFLDLFGKLWYLPSPYARGNFGLTTLRKETMAPGNEILFIASGLSKGKINVVTRSRPRTVLTFGSSGNSFLPLLEWYSKNSTEYLVGSLDLPAPIKGIVANYQYMTVLTEDDEVFTWSSLSDTVSTPLKTRTPPKKRSLSAISENYRVPSSPEDGEEEEDDGPDMSGLLDDFFPAIPKQGTPPQEAPRYSRVPLPPTTKISANFFVTAAVARERLYLWCTPEAKEYCKNFPTIPSLGDASLPRIQDIVNEDGKPYAITDVSVGKSHIITLSADGSIFSIGRGWYGELGIGPRYFDLRVEERDGCSYDQEDAVEFAETWQRMETEGVLMEDMEWVGVMAGKQTSFALARKRVNSV